MDDYNLRLSQNAYNEIKKGNFSKAIAYFNQVLESEENTIILQDKGYCLNEMKRYDEAIICFDRVISIENNKNSENYVNAWYNKGRSFIALNKLEEAMACFNIVLSINPDYENAKKAKDMIIKNNPNILQNVNQNNPQIVLYNSRKRNYGNIYIHILFILIGFFLFYPAFLLNIVYLIYSYSTS